ncbi:MAG: TonB-dependent receptor plug domain-containing protein [Nitrospiraceae bacterium]|nr:TonB-dependent receptor plug domain-containing protein [Nitrospiraceae bacterium]
MICEWRQYVSAISFGVCILFMAMRGLASGSNAPVNMGTIVVTANATEPGFQTGDVDTELTPAFYSIIKRKRFEGKIEGLSQILKEEPSIQVRQSGGMGSFSSISIRGASSDQVNIFLDGILLNDASGGGVDLSNISLSDVGAIEIYRGITPANFAPASIGGVVNIRTRRIKKGIKSSITTGYGSFNTRKLGTFINYKPGKWDCLISGDYLGSDNDFRFLNNMGTVFNKADDRIERRHNAEFDQKNLLTKFGLDITDNVRVDLLNQSFLKDQNLPDWKNNRNTRTSFDTRRDITTFKFTANDIGPIHLNTSTQVYYGWKNEDYDDRLGQIGGNSTTSITHGAVAPIYFWSG